MSPELNQSEVERLFLGAMDDVLTEPETERLGDELSNDPKLRERFDQYARTVALLRGQPREKAPEALSTIIMRRTRRRRSVTRAAFHNQLAYRVPIEVVIPILIAAMVALFMLVASR